MTEIKGDVRDIDSIPLAGRFTIKDYQRQRVALARAFYHEREVIVMDEATSSIDNETEQEIVNEILQLKGKKTMIIIAHRLTTLRYCDRIYRLENGNIIEHGTYEEIIKL